MPTSKPTSRYDTPGRILGLDARVGLQSYWAGPGRSCRLVMCVWHSVRGSTGGWVAFLFHVHKALPVKTEAGCRRRLNPPQR